MCNTEHPPAQDKYIYPKDSLLSVPVKDTTLLAEYGNITCTPSDESTAEEKQRADTFRMNKLHSKHIIIVHFF